MNDLSSTNPAERDHDALPIGWLCWRVLARLVPAETDEGEERVDSEDDEGGHAAMTKLSAVTLPPDRAMMSRIVSRDTFC
ncbi:hypothetical protein [Sphingomonas oryzagri]|uniref:Uncharacterized protein n=1 Tax=Sphingomonas oryzagri TaxID=3042314 RepID=A0ABT6N0V7_9SPHN|nr:hypothetical protein [Sphingomonas oryzagri]MDH7638933.1 hypothetical protein [Sphingomonas oryzagri]